MALLSVPRHLWPCITNTRPWLYKSSLTRFFKAPNGLVWEKRPWPYNRGNTAIVMLKRNFDFYIAKLLIESWCNCKIFSSILMIVLSTYSHWCPFRLMCFVFRYVFYNYDSNGAWMTTFPYELAITEISSSSTFSGSGISSQNSLPGLFPWTTSFPGSGKEISTSSGA